MILCMQGNSESLLSLAVLQTWRRSYRQNGHGNWGHAMMCIFLALLAINSIRVTYYAPLETISNYQSNAYLLAKRSYYSLVSMTINRCHLPRDTISQPSAPLQQGVKALTAWDPIYPNACVCQPNSFPASTKACQCVPKRLKAYRSSSCR